MASSDEPHDAAPPVGAHQMRWSSGDVRERRDACLRCVREDHSKRCPSGRLQVTLVLNGPTDLCVVTVHPDGVIAYSRTGRSVVTYAGGRGVNGFSSSCPFWITP